MQPTARPIGDCLEHTTGSEESADLFGGIAQTLALLAMFVFAAGLMLNITRERLSPSVQFLIGHGKQRAQTLKAWRQIGVAGSAVSTLTGLALQLLALTSR